MHHAVLFFLSALKTVAELVLVSIGIQHREEESSQASHQTMSVVGVIDDFTMFPAEAAKSEQRPRVILE